MDLSFNKNFTTNPDKIAIHYHVHQHIAVHIHKVSIGETFLLKNESNAEPPLGFPEVIPGTGNQTGAFYVPNTLNYTHKPEAMVHYEYTRGTCKGKYAQEIRGEGSAKEIETVASKCVNREKFSYTPFNQTASKHHAHYHFHYLKLEHNHTAGVRETSAP